MLSIKYIKYNKLNNTHHQWKLFGAEQNSALDYTTAGTKLKASALKCSKTLQLRPSKRIQLIFPMAFLWLLVKLEATHIQ